MSDDERMTTLKTFALDRFAAAKKNKLKQTQNALEGQFIEREITFWKMVDHLVVLWKSFEQKIKSRKKRERSSSTMMIEQRPNQANLIRSSRRMNVNCVDLNSIAFSLNLLLS